MQSDELVIAANELGRMAVHLYRLTIDGEGQFYGLLCPPADDCIVVKRQPFVTVCGERRNTSFSEYALRITIRGEASDLRMFFKQVSSDDVCPLSAFPVFLAETDNPCICPTENELRFFVQQHGGTFKIYD